MTEAAIVFENVTKYYESHLKLNAGFKSIILNFMRQGHRVDRKLVLDDLSFQINHGESVGFIGKNGAGKSTLLGLIASVMRQTSGRIAAWCGVPPGPDR